jgi:hypothetical protein
MPSGEANLQQLLASLEPRLDESGSYAFVTCPLEQADLHAKDALATFREQEGLTLILPIEKAAQFEQRSTDQTRITLQCHSSLDAVGLTYKVSERLTGEFIPCNVVAGYYHDHLFVPTERAIDALNSLAAMQKTAADEAAGFISFD